MRRNRPEECLHRTVAQFLWAACPQLVWFTVTNQRGTRKRFEQGVLSALGVRPGVTDIVLILPGGLFGGIELKAAKGRLGENQRTFRDEVLGAGGKWAMCRTLDEVVVTLARWGVRMRVHGWRAVA